MQFVDREVAAHAPDRSTDQAAVVRENEPFGPPDAAPQLLQVFEVEVDEIAQRLADAGRLRRWLFATADPALLLRRSSLGFDLETERAR